VFCVASSPNSRFRWTILGPVAHCLTMLRIPLNSTGWPFLMTPHINSGPWGKQREDIRLSEDELRTDGLWRKPMLSLCKRLQLTVHSHIQHARLSPPILSPDLGSLQMQRSRRKWLEFPFRLFFAEVIHPFYWLSVSPSWNFNHPSLSSEQTSVRLLSL
jgi:hypothetical protein